MRLGNSNGNNIGKKYLDRDNLDYGKLTGEDYIRLDDFNTWYTDNIDTIECKLKEKNCFNEDIVSDTYVKMCESILFSKLEIEDYKKYFSRAYYTNRVQSKVHESRYTLPDNEHVIATLLDQFAIDNNEPNDIRNQMLIDEVLLFVKRYHSQRDYYLFFRYMELEGGERTYKNVSKLTGLKVHVIGKAIYNIKVNIQSNMDLTSKRKQIQ